MKKIIYFLLAVLTFGACAPSAPKPTKETYVYKTFSDSTDAYYAELFNTLSIDYVTHGRTVDWSYAGFTPNDSMYTADSLKYAEALERFYNGGLEMVDWLMSLHADTLQKGLWSMSAHPLSSYLSECNIFPTHAQAGIILLENFLGEKSDELHCLECRTCKECNSSIPQLCVQERYSRMEFFLASHKGASVDELRKAWAERIKE